MLNEKLWKEAQKQAKRTYEKEYGCWEDADKYERQDLVFSEYMKLKGGGNKMIRYYVSGIGYDENDCITDYEKDFGDFDIYEEAYELFVKLQCRSEESFFTKAPKICQLLVQLEECKETDEGINCIDVKNEWWIINPNYKEEV